MWRILRFVPIIGVGMLIVVFYGAYRLLGASTPRAADDASPSPESSGAAPATASSLPTSPSAVPRNGHRSLATIGDTLVDLVVRRGSALVPLAPGGLLHSREEYAFQVTASEPCYAVVLELAPSGILSRLYPEHGEMLLATGQSLLIPPEKIGHLQLDDHVGVERVILALTRRPNESVSSGTFEGRLIEDPHWPAPWVVRMPPPTTGHLAQRGSELTLRGSVFVPAGQGREGRLDLVGAAFIEFAHVADEHP